MFHHRLTSVVAIIFIASALSGQVCTCMYGRCFVFVAVSLALQRNWNLNSAMPPLEDLGVIGAANYQSRTDTICHYGHGGLHFTRGSLQQAAQECVNYCNSQAGCRGMSYYGVTCHPQFIMATCEKNVASRISWKQGT